MLIRDLLMLLKKDANDPEVTFYNVPEDMIVTIEFSYDWDDGDQTNTTKYTEAVGHIQQLHVEVGDDPTWLAYSPFGSGDDEPEELDIDRDYKITIWREEGYTPHLKPIQDQS